VRDLWPDTIVDMFPSWSRRVARLALRRDFAKTRFAMRQATCLCAMSAGVMQWGLGYADRTVGPWDRIIPIGYPAPSASADKDESAELCEVLTKMKNRQMYAYVGTFGHTYNLAAIVRTARRLLTAGRDDLGFMLAGNGPQYKEVQRLVDGLPNVLLTGWLGAREIRTILSRARAGLLPWNTINDAMPNKFFEYISEGLPVISSAEGELNDLIEREGIGRTYRKGNEVELSQALLELNDNEDFANRCAERSKALFERKFREDAVYGAYAAYVEEIAAGKRN